MLGHHDGYARGPEGIVHRRAVWLRSDRYLVVYDEFAGAGVHRLEVNYQFAPGELVPAADGAALFDEAVDIAWVGNGDWQAEIAHGGRGPQDGWIAPSLGVRQAAPRLRITCQAAQPPASLVTVLAARTSQEARVARVASGAAGASSRLLAVSGRGFVDWIVAGPARGAGPIDTDATLTICRLRGDDCVEKDHIGGTRVDVDAPTLARLSPDGWQAVGTAR
jgi:hypothetical protein